MEMQRPRSYRSIPNTVLKADIKSPLKYNNATVYWQIIGSIIYLLNYTYPNTSYAVASLPTLYREQNIIGYYSRA